MRTLAALLVVVCCISFAHAWFCTGHMTIAQIAKNNLTSDIVSKIEGYIKTLSDAGPFPKNADMITAACWADDMNGYGLPEMQDWHFINQPYDPSNFPFTGNPVDPENVEVEVAAFVDSLKGQAKPYAIQFALAYLLHLMGDLHQPLHVTELFSSTYPTGDGGGRFILVTVDGNKTKLHDVWDAICWQYPFQWPRPLNSQHQQEIVDYAQKLTKKYEVSEADRGLHNTTQIGEEGVHIAATVAYPGTYSGMTISQDYINNCIPAAEMAITKAGWRLGHELNFVFGHKEEDHVKVLHERVIQLHREAVEMRVRAHKMTRRHK